MSKKIIYTIVIVLSLVSCSLFDVHPYDGEIDGETGLNGKNTSIIENNNSGKDTIRFAVISDTQRWYDETKDEVRSINERDDIDFVIHCGDQSDFGVTKEFELQRDILSGLKVPYVMLLGNHDCIGSGKEVYRTMYGAENFSFVAGPTRFVCLDTNALEYDFSNPVPDLEYMDSWANDKSCCNTIVVMHVPPFGDEFNNNVSKPFEYEVTQRLNNTLCCIYGHGHSTEAADIFGDGMMYYQITCAKYRQYYVFTVSKEGYSYETVDY